MKVLYLSSLCSIKEYERMFKLYGSTSSHASQKFNRLLVYGLKENGCDVETLTQRVVCSNNGKEDYKRPSEIEAGIKYNYLPRVDSKYLNRIKTITSACVEIRHWCKKNPKGVIIADIILGELSIALLLAKLFGIKNKTVAIVTDVPNIRAGDTRKGIKAIPIEIKNKLIEIYDSYIFLTQQMNEVLNPQNKPYVIVEGIVDADILNIPNELENKYSEKIIMMAGLLEDVFGVDILVEAFKNIKDDNARLKLYGKGNYVKQILEASKQDARIMYCGELPNDQIVVEEKKATLLINPRPPEGEWTAYSFPSKNMEYMASGTPLVAFDLPCIPKEYKDYFYVINKNNQDNLKKMLMELMNKDKVELHNKGISAQKWIVENKCAKKQSSYIVEMLRNINVM